MRAGRLLLACIVGLAGLALAAAWLVPPRLDWNRYRSTIEVVASRALGRSVSIEGPVSLALLPEPLLTADRVNVAESRAASSGAALRVHSLMLRIALGPLLAGRIVPREVVLRQPELTLPWPFPAQPPDWFERFSARVEDGRLTIGQLAFTDIDARLEGADAGWLSIAGTARSRGLGWHFTARLTAPDGDGAQGLDLALDGQGAASGLGATLAGQIEPDGSLAGHVAGRGPDLSVLMPAPQVAFRGAGRLTVAAGLAAADDLSLEVAGSPVQGAVALRISPEERLDIALSASRLDLGQWLPTLPALQDAALPVGLDLSADAAQLGGGTLRRLRAALDLSAGEATLREATALLPGEADLRVTGRMERAGPTVGAFSGALRFAAPDLRATLRWLDQIGAIRLAALPPGVLRSATLSGALTAQDNSFIVHDMTGKIDGGPVAGSLRLVAGRQPWLEADLRTDRLALDPWLPAEPPGAGFAASLPEGRLKLLARRAVLRGVAVDDLQLDASAQGGRLVVAALEGAARGARFRASGGFADGDRLADAHLTVNAADASSLLPLVPPEWRGAPELWAGPLDLDIAADGHLETLAVRAALDLDDARLEAQPVIDLMHRRWRGPVTLRHPGASRLLAAAGLLPSARWIGEGSLALIGRFSGEPGRIAADSFDLVAGGMRATGALALDRSEAGPNLTGRVAAETLPLVLPDFSDTAPLPVDALHGWRASVKVEAGTLLAGQRPLIERAAALVSLDSGRLHLDQLDGRFAGGTLAGSADFDASGPVPSLVLDAALGGADAGALAGDVPVGPIAGRIDAELALTARGHSPAALLATAAGTLRVTATGGTLSGFSLGRMREALEAARGDPLPVTDAAVRAALAGGTSPFDSFRLEGRLEHGEFAVTSAALSGADGAANASGTIGLPSGLLDLHATVRPAVEDPPELGLRITGPADRPRQVPELTGLARWAGDHPPP